MRICKKCGKEKPNNAFYKREFINGRIGYRKICIDCTRALINKRSLEYRSWVTEYKLQRGCSICGYKKCAQALVFHHKNPKEKDFNIGQFKTYSRKRVMAEINKCVLICQNCHMELEEL